MKYDTLILSGGSVKGFAFLGSFKYLFDKNIIDRKNIKHIICASAGSFTALMLLFNINYDLILKIMMKAEIKLYDSDKFNFKNIVDNYGAFDNFKIENYVKIFCKYFLKKDNITLKELYNYNKIKFTVKVSNISKCDLEYINYLNYPDLDIVTLIKMATSIPFLFKPVNYNNCFYCDGATGGGLPIEYNKSKKYLAICILPFDNEKRIKNFLDYLYSLYKVYSSGDTMNFYKKYKNIIYLDMNSSLKIEIDSKSKKYFFKEGFLQTKKYFEN